MFHARPAAGYADLRTPVRGLYQAGSATHGGGGVTGIPGRNVVRQVLTDRRAERWRRRVSRPAKASQAAKSAARLGRAKAANRAARRTRAAERLGESSGTCSFHLRQLAKYGLVEIAGRYYENLMRWLEASPEEPPAWQEAALLGDQILYVTAEELSELGRQVEELVDRYFERQVKPELRPPGARQVSYLHIAFPSDMRP
jgi:hypothetical protein